MYLVDANILVYSTDEGPRPYDYPSPSRRLNRGPAGPGPGGVQHAGNTDGTALRDTRRHGC